MTSSGPEAFRLADPMLDRELLLGIEFDDRARANQKRATWVDATMFPALFASAARRADPLSDAW